MSASYDLVPAPGVSFATHGRDLDSRLKERVAQLVLSAAWNPYVGVDVKTAGSALARGLKIEVEGTRSSIHRGAEAALRALVATRKPSQLFVPANAYPGFGRTAAATRTPIVGYRDAKDLERARRDDVVVVTLPGSPVDVDDVGKLFAASVRCRASVVMDATFALLDAEGAAAVAETARSNSADLIVSASKSLGLAGVRLGLLLDRGQGDETEANPMELDVFQCAVLEALLENEGRAVADRAASVARRQRSLQARLVNALRKSGADVVHDGNAFAVTIRDPAPDEGRYGASGWKGYPRLGLVRLDASEAMTVRMEATR
ncbi:hypothetical protein GCM10017714_31310 [Curtobacterium pusillum]|uniref:Aminotransferase class I/II-fold pyridoxal phosphate-dependent enzyme n=1 Tax=Curtobacterium pusillum TaxID=69373 RepID=A0ABX2M8K1_9MICO|nr:aminotransferase class I/II-fold pyridoxal phosphate-dependent enzyme [Curtobacterium pusillum]NUU13235.1 aminotransferase class I/II-fold pyridoxal phosphate-dependent enzyme [Curtobacterium pusillum]GLK31835.1 hypothetical protein GCM10017610_21200 [Curtobacterium pusillum]